MPHPLHVLVLPFQYPSRAQPVRGTFCHDQVRGLARAGLRVGVAYAESRGLEQGGPLLGLGEAFRTTETDEDGVPTLRRLGWAPPKMPHLRARSLRWWWHRLVARYIARHGKPDLIHAHGVLWAGVAAHDAFEAHGIPYLVTEHFTHFVRGLIRPFEAHQARIAYGSARRVMAVSRPLAGAIYPYCRGIEPAVVPNIVDTEFFSPEPAPAPSSRYTFLTVGRLAPVKGFDILVKALGSSPGLADTCLDIIGGGNERSRLQRLARSHGVQQRVRLLGPRPRTFVRDRMRAADCFVSSSRYETFGVAVAEALACGIPAVVTRCCGPEDFVTDAVGRAVESENPRALAGAMIEIYRDRTTWRTRRPEIAAYAGAFSEQRVIATTLSIYEAALAAC